MTERTDATRVRVTLTRTPTDAVFQAADDGRSSTRALRPGGELMSARERLRLVGGRLTVVTPPAAGTIIRAAVPA